MRKTNSTILAAVREAAKGLHEAGMMDRGTLHEFYRLCLPQISK